MKHATLRWIAILPAAVGGALFGRLMAYFLSFSVDLWPVSPAPLWLQHIDGLLIYFLCPACFITLGTHVAPQGHRTVAVVLAVAYFGFVFLAVLRLAALSSITAYGWLGLVVSLLSSVSSVVAFFGRKEPIEDESASFLKSPVGY